MAITKKPTPFSTSVVANDKAIESVINKGLASQEEVKLKNSKKVTAIVIRMPGDLLLKIDEIVQRRAVKIPRHTWILEAIVEKVNYEQKEKQEPN